MATRKNRLDAANARYAEALLDLQLDRISSRLRRRLRETIKTVKPGDTVSMTGQFSITLELDEHSEWRKGAYHTDLTFTSK